MKHGLIAIFLPLLLLACDASDSSTHATADEQSEAASAAQDSTVAAILSSNEGVQVTVKNDTFLFTDYLDDDYYSPENKPDTLDNSYFLTIGLEKSDEFYTWHSIDSSELKTGNIIIKKSISTPNLVYGLTVKDRNKQVVLKSALSKKDIAQWIPWGGFVSYSLISRFTLLDISTEHRRALISFTFGEPETDSGGEFIAVITFDGTIRFIGGSRFWGGNHVDAHYNPSKTLLLCQEGIIDMKTYHVVNDFHYSRGDLVYAHFLSDDYYVEVHEDPTESLLDVYKVGSAAIEYYHTFSGFMNEFGYECFAFSDNQEAKHYMFDPSDKMFHVFQKTQPTIPAQVKLGSLELLKDTTGISATHDVHPIYYFNDDGEYQMFFYIHRENNTLTSYFSNKEE